MRILALLLLISCAVGASYSENLFVKAIFYGLGSFTAIGVFLKFSTKPDRETQVGIATKIFTSIAILWSALCMCAVLAPATDYSLFSSYVLGSLDGDFRLSIQLDNDAEYQDYAIGRIYRVIAPALLATIIYAVPSVWLTWNVYSWRRFPVVSLVLSLMFLNIASGVDNPDQKVMAPVKVSDCKAVFSTGSKSSSLERESKVVYDPAKGEFDTERNWSYQPSDKNVWTMDASMFTGPSCIDGNQTRSGLFGEACATYKLCISAVKYNSKGGKGDFRELSYQEAKDFLTD
jgi:hypothetical protein